MQPQVDQVHWVADALRQGKQDSLHTKMHEIKHPVTHPNTHYLNPLSHFATEVQ